MSKNTLPLETGLEVRIMEKMPLSGTLCARDEAAILANQWYVKLDDASRALILASNPKVPLGSISGMERAIKSLLATEVNTQRTAAIPFGDLPQDMQAKRLDAWGPYPSSVLHPLMETVAEKKTWARLSHSRPVKAFKLVSKPIVVVPAFVLGMGMAYWQYRQNRKQARYRLRGDTVLPPREPPQWR